MSNVSSAKEMKENASADQLAVYGRRAIYSAEKRKFVVQISRVFDLKTFL